MVASSQTLDQLLAQIAGMDSTEASNQVRDSMSHFKEHASDDDFQTVRRALSKRLNELADQGEREHSDLLRVNGIEYDLSKWLTIANYAKKYNLDTHVITNRIRRKTIPEDAVITIPVLNNIRMIKDQPFN